LFGVATNQFPSNWKRGYSIVEKKEAQFFVVVGFRFFEAITKKMSPPIVEKKNSHSLSATLSVLPLVFVPEETI